MRPVSPLTMADYIYYQAVSLLLPADCKAASLLYQLLDTENAKEHLYLSWLKM